MVEGVDGLVIEVSLMPFLLFLVFYVVGIVCSVKLFFPELKLFIADREKDALDWFIVVVFFLASGVVVWFVFVAVAIEWVASKLRRV